MLEETLDDPPVNMSCHVTAVSAVPSHDDEHCPHTTQQALRLRAVLFISKSPRK